MRVIVSLLALCAAAAAAAPSPFVFFPGLDAQVLEAKLDHIKRPSILCPGTRNWFTIWMADEMLVPGFRECFFGEFGLDFENGEWANRKGMSVRPQDFPSWTGVQEFRLFGKNITMYATLWANLTALGYVDGVNTAAASYDFRMSPGQLMQTSYPADVKAVVERLYAQNGNEKVFLVGHSYGCSIAHGFLGTVDQAWKDQYIAGFVSFSGPYLGTPVTTFIMLSGSMGGAHNVFTLPAKDLSLLVRQLGVGYALLPYPQSIYYNTSVIGLPQGNFTLAQFRSLFAALPDKLNMTGRYETVQDLLTVTPPGVTTHCVNGYGVKTVGSIYFNKTDPTGVPPFDATFIDGDSVVDRYSLNQCQRWTSQQSQPITSMEIPGMIHGEAPFIPQVFAWWMKIMNAA
jgi:hypothetical protein